MRSGFSLVREDSGYRVRVTVSDSDKEKTRVTPTAEAKVLPKGNGGVVHFNTLIIFQPHSVRLIQRWRGGWLVQGIVGVSSEHTSQGVLI